MSYSTLNGIEVILVAGALVIGWLRWLVLRLCRSRPGLSIGYATAAGITARFISLAAVSSLGVGRTLRGGDELGFTQAAHALAASPLLSSGWLPSSGTNPLHVVLFALQYKLGGFSDAALRITQVGIAMTGLLLFAAATYELAGARAARWTAWALALEPANIFFSGLLHKEPNIMLASGLIVFGGTKFWLHMRWRHLAPVALGAAIAITTRSYAGWFLVTGAILVGLHAAVRHFDVRRGGGRSFAVVYAIVVALIVLTPTLVALSSHHSLQQHLQVSQTANTTALAGPDATANGNNLELEQIDFSSRSAIVSNLPRRLRDLLLRPYPWQLGSVNQQVALPGSLAALVVLLLLFRLAWAARGSILRSTAPILYPGGMLAVAYALAVGNAGTGFRYRTDILPFAIAAAAVLWARPDQQLRASLLGVGTSPSRPAEAAGVTARLPPWPSIQAAARPDGAGGYGRNL